LCRDHWKDWDAIELFDCERCHWFFDGGGFIASEERTFPGGLESVCNECVELFDLRLIERELANGGENADLAPYHQRIWERWTANGRPIHPILDRASIERSVRYVYILKLSDGTFYAGQTNALKLRLQEHHDGLQRQTKGKDPKLVYYERFRGEREEVDDIEQYFSELCRTGSGQRVIRTIIEEFRTPLRLLDLDA